MKRVIWCTPGHAQEAMWISQVSERGFTIVRRCVEAVDVLAAASIESDAAVVLDIDTPRLSADTIAAIPGAGARTVVALVSGEESAHRARHWGIGTTVCYLDTDAVDRIVTALSADRAGGIGGGTPEFGSAVAGDGVRGITAIYGPTGSPGRSTVALGLAEAWARSGERVCLIDADTLGPSLAVLVGMTEDISGVLVAARYADQGALDLRSLGSACRKLDDRLWLMSGVGSPERWHQLRPTSLDRVLRACAEQFDRVVVDTNPLLAHDSPDDLLPGGLPPRDCATRSVLSLSDVILTVTRPDVVHVMRLAGDLPSVASLSPQSLLSVVVNRTSRTDGNAGSQVQDVLTEAGINVPVYCLPEDRSVHACRRSGSLLWESPATKKVRRSLLRIGTSLAA